MKNTKTILADADFVIEDADNFRRRADVFIEAGKITKVRDASASYDDHAEVIDCRGLLLMPGLVNAHTHLFQVLTRGLGKHLKVRDWAAQVTYPLARKLTGSDYYHAALLACADAIRNGCTAVVDHPTHYARFYADESCRAMEVAGLRGVVARGPADHSLVDPGEVRVLGEDLEATADFVQRWGTQGRVQGWVGPSGFHTCTAEGIRAAKKLARRLGTRFHFHLAESHAGKEEAEQLGYQGEVSLAKAFGLLDKETSVAHAIWVSDSEVETLAASGCQVVHCATSNQILASGIAPIPKMIAQGVTIALATDGASSNDSLDMIAELKAAALIHRVQSLDPTAIGAKEVFRAATEGGAHLLGQSALGRLAEGYAADITGVRLTNNPSLVPCHDPLTAVVFYASGRDVSLVIVDGNILMRDGCFSTIDISDTIRQVNATLSRVVD